jgi:hypothetical protein
MSNANTGLLSALGAILGGAAGAMAGKYAAQFRPRASYAFESDRGAEIEDAMIVGGATGAVVGAFIGGTLAAPDPTAVSTPQQLR